MSRRSRLTASLLAVSCGGLALSAAPTAHAADPGAGLVLSPIGGGYESPALRGFALEVAAHATGATVDILVVPSAYGDALEDRDSNLELAGQRAQQIDSECDAAVAGSSYAARFPAGCRATLLTLLDRSDASNPSNSNAFRDADTDGSFVLGGDQVLAMQVLANTPAESSMEYAARHGVVFGGTSAGNAVESRSMGAGYADSGYPENAMERGQALIYWGDNLSSDERGLSFGSQRIILDQHFYQRGRFGRLLAYTAESVGRYGGAGKLGLGVDYATGVAVTDDATVSRPFGASSSAFVDLKHASAPAWVGPRQTLTVRHVLTHLMAPGTGMTYDVASRRPSVGGTAVAAPRPAALPALSAKRTLLLGGGQNDTASSEPLRSLVSAATRKGPIVVIVAAYTDTAAARAAAATYATALRGAGWRGPVRTAVQGADRVNPGTVAGAAGVVFVGGDQSLVPNALRDKQFAQAVKVATTTTAVLTDGAMTPAMGTSYLANPDPELFDEDAAIAQFRTDYPVVARGLGIVPGYRFEPELTEGYRWGRLYTGAKAAPATVGVGISERTALRVGSAAPLVVGERSVVVADGRQARWLPGSNGALGAVNVWLSTFGPTSQVS